MVQRINVIFFKNGYLSLKFKNLAVAPTCEKNVQIKLTPKNFLLIVFNVVYIEVNETRKKL
jgi:hypothetical protein